MSNTEMTTFATSETARVPTRFHLSLNSRNLDASIGFFRAFFGREPVKSYPDYAKFELDDPPLVLSLEPIAASGTGPGNLNHLGFRVPSSEALVDVQKRLEFAGITTQREDGVECCYARQTKFWVNDPDGNMWEVYTLDEDIQHSGDGRVPDPIENNLPDETPLSRWQHRLGNPFPEQLPILDQTVDLVHLEGTFNQRLEKRELLRRLREIHRILKPGGAVEARLLTSNRSTGDQQLHLAGPAAVVEVVPSLEDVKAYLTEAGFQNLEVTYLANSPCFTSGDCQFRGTRIRVLR